MSEYRLLPIALFSFFASILFLASVLDFFVSPRQVYPQLPFFSTALMEDLNRKIVTLVVIAR